MLVIVNHLSEIKTRVLYLLFSFIFTFLIGYSYSDVMMFICVLPFITKFSDKRFIYTDLSEAFSSCLMISFNVSTFFTFLFFIYEVFSFLKPGLYKRELRIVKFSLQLLFVSSIVAIFFVYQLFLPGMISFFSHFESLQLFSLVLEAKIFEYLYLVLNCLLWISLLFQLPSLIFLLLYLKFIDITSILLRRKECILLCFVCGAMFSPPDILSQLLIAFPLWLFLEIIILLFMIIDRYKSVSYGELLEW